MAPWADVVYACDLPWWEVYAKDVRSSCSGERWSMSRPVRSRYGANYVEGRSGEGLCRLPGIIYSGGNSGYQAVGLAHQFGAKRIVLLGYDMQRTRNRSHWHGDHPGALGNGNNFAAWVRRFGVMATGLRAAGVRVINASRETALRCFERESIAEVLNAK